MHQLKLQKMTCVTKKKKKVKKWLLVMIYSLCLPSLFLLAWKWKSIKSFWVRQQFYLMFSFHCLWFYDFYFGLHAVALQVLCATCMGFKHCRKNYFKTTFNWIFQITRSINPRFYHMFLNKLNKFDSCSNHSRVPLSTWTRCHSKLTPWHSLQENNGSRWNRGLFSTMYRPAAGNWRLKITQIVKTYGLVEGSILGFKSDWNWGGIPQP